MSSAGIGPGSTLLSTEYHFGMCLSLVHLLQTFMKSTYIDGKHSKQTEQAEKHEDSKLRRLLWNVYIFLMMAGSLNWRRNVVTESGSEGCAKAWSVMTHTFAVAQFVVTLAQLVVLSSLLCLSVIAALLCRIYSRFLRLLTSASSKVSLSLLMLYCSLLWAFLHSRCSLLSILHK